MKKIVFGVDGMRCGMCESHVNDVVRRVDGVKKVTSSAAKNRTEVVAEDTVKVADVRAAIEKEGYRVLSEDISDYEKKGLFGLFKK